MSILGILKTDHDNHPKKYINSMSNLRKRYVTYEKIYDSGKKTKEDTVDRNQKSIIKGIVGATKRLETGAISDICQK